MCVGLCSSWLPNQPFSNSTKGCGVLDRRASRPGSGNTSFADLCVPHTRTQPAWQTTATRRQARSKPDPTPHKQTPSEWPPCPAPTRRHWHPTRRRRQPSNTHWWQARPQIPGDPVPTSLARHGCSRPLRRVGTTHPWVARPAPVNPCLGRAASKEPCSGRSDTRLNRSPQPAGGGGPSGCRCLAG